MPKSLFTIIYVSLMFALVGTIDAQTGVLQQNKTNSSKKPDNRVFGMTLGEKFSISECQWVESKPTAFDELLKKSNMLPSRRGYYKVAKELCFEIPDGYLAKVANEGIDSLLQNGQVNVRFPFEEKPEIVKGWLVAFLLNGNLEGVGFETNGLKNDKVVLKNLEEKYGPPSLFLPRKMQNGFGASFESFDATWSFATFKVHQFGLMKEIDVGWVQIDSKKKQDLEEQAEQKQRDIKRKL